MGKLRMFFYDLFHKRKEELKGMIYSNTIYTNDYVNLVHDACVISHGGSTDKPIEKKESFISKIIGFQHESVIEHSNIIQCYKMKKQYLEELTELLPNMHYLQFKIKYTEDNINLLIGGTIRGYKNFIREVDDTDNSVFKAILSEMYNIKPCFFEDFIKDGVMNRNLFTDVIIGDSLKMSSLSQDSLDENLDMKEELSTDYYSNIIKEDKFEISSMDNIKDIKILCDNTFGKDVFNIDDILDVTSITILFKDLSRIISQQVTRHRNGITQLSQRYVDYSDIPFNAPSDFKPDIYDKDKEYVINISDNKSTAQFSFTQQSLGDAICKIYPQMREQGLMIEDARAYLPNNVTTSLYMTFTYRSLIKFLQLRCDKSAQAEIREIAQSIEPYIKDYFINNLNDNDIYKHLLPKYESKQSQEYSYDDIDEIIEE